jgi:hypothetical protein
MEEERAEGQEDAQAGEGRERRAHPRYPVDVCAALLLVNHGRSIAGQMIEVSESGCRLRTPFPFTAGIKTQVEIAFRIHGRAFRFDGVVEWAQARHVGVRFVDVPLRRRLELFDLLLESEADLAAQAAAKVFAAQPLSKSPSRTGAQPAHNPTDRKTKIQPFAESAQPGKLPHAGSDPQMNATRQPLPEQTDSASSSSHVQHQASHRGYDRRTQTRVAVDTSVDMILIHVGCRLPGRIQDMSVGGCRIHTDEPFPVGIFTRVETEFRLQGLPFRLIGVIQAVHDQQRQIVGVRFLDMSARKREQVEQLIKEIEREREQQLESHAGNWEGSAGEAMGV